MLQKSLNYLRGNMRVKVTCPYPERFVNICASNGVEFWDLTRISKCEVHISTYIAGYKKLVSLAESGNYTISPVKKTGVPFFLWKVRKRYVLLAGMVAVILSVWILSFFVWEINVTGNKTVSSTEILRALKEMDIGIGTFGPDVVNMDISNQILLKIPELSFITVNVNGSRANVIVRERIVAPDIVDEKTPTLIYALKSGIITKMSVLEGVRVKTEGDTVLAGDVIVTGAVDTKTTGTRFVHAMAEVYARTWYEMSGQMPLSTMKKSYTGDTKTKFALIIAGKRLNLYFNSGIPWVNYDKITSVNTVKLPTGNVLPFSIVQEKYSRFDAIPAVLSIEEAEKILSEGLEAKLKAQLLNGEIITMTFGTTLDNGVVTVKMKAECLEQIAGMRKLTDEEMIQEKNKETEKGN